METHPIEEVAAMFQTFYQVNFLHFSEIVFVLELIYIRFYSFISYELYFEPIEVNNYVLVMYRY